MTDLSDAEFYDQVWDHKCPELGTMCIELDDKDWDFVIGKTYQLLCQKFNCDPEGENPLVNMMTQDMNWISHAKNFGVIEKRTPKEAKDWRELQAAMFNLDPEVAVHLEDREIFHDDFENMEVVEIGEGFLEIEEEAKT